MPQLTIYLDAEEEAAVREAARREGKSLSRWAGEQFARAVLAEKETAWDHARKFVGTIHEDDGFEVPSRSGEHRPVPNFDD